MSTSTILPMYDTAIPLLKVARIARQMRLSIQPLACIWHLAHPAHLCTIDILDFQSLALFSEFLGHSLNIDIKVVPQELSNLGVLVVSLERSRGFGIRRVDVHIGGAVAVSRPAGLSTARNHVRILVECGCRFPDELGDLVRGRVVDTQAGGDGFADKFSGFVGRGVRCEVCVVGESEVLGGVRGVSKRRRVPDVFRVLGVEFCWMC